MNVVWHMLYESFGTWKLMVAFIFKFGLRKGQCQAKLDQISSIFQMQHFLTKTCLSCPVLSQDSKNVYFHVRQIEMPKTAFQKSDVITFTQVFLPLHSKNKDIALEFGMCLVCMSVYIIFSVFYNSETFYFVGIIYFWEIEILSLGSQNPKILIRDSHFV